MQERVIILGKWNSELFVPWIQRHAAKLDLSPKKLTATDEQITFELDGAPELLDAMEVACLLGPFTIWVEEIKRTALPLDSAID